MVYDEDIDHFYLNGIGERVEEMITRLNVLFWNSNGWKHGENVDKQRMICETAAREDIELIFLVDTRLDNMEG